MLEIQEEMKEYQKKKQQNELGLMKKRQVARMRDTIRNCGTKGRYQVEEPIDLLNRSDMNGNLSNAGGIEKSLH